VNDQIDLTGGHVMVANRIFAWNIDSNGGARINEQGVATVDRMVAALISISNNWCADPRGVARRALTGE
jgi:hypothetical protein